VASEHDDRRREARRSTDPEDLVNRTRWLVVAAVLAVGFVGASINARGPFDERPSLAYAQFLADIGTGRVDRVTRWRDRLEVAEGERIVIVTVPAEADLAADLAAAEAAGGTVPGIATIPDDWLVSYTPWIAGLLVVAGTAVWVRAILPGRSRGNRDVAAAHP
jgi:hypothetical protein